MTEIPENKYVFPPDASWCFLWSFEDDLYFGRCPTGRRDPAGSTARLAAASSSLRRTDEP